MKGYTPMQSTVISKKRTGLIVERLLVILSKPASHPSEPSVSSGEGSMQYNGGYRVSVNTYLCFKVYLYSTLFRDNTKQCLYSTLFSDNTKQCR